MHEAWRNRSGPVGRLWSQASGRGRGRRAADGVGRPTLPGSGQLFQGCGEPTCREAGRFCRAVANLAGVTGGQLCRDNGQFAGQRPTLPGCRGDHFARTVANFAGRQPTLPG